MARFGEFTSLSKKSEWDRWVVHNRIQTLGYQGQNTAMAGFEPMKETQKWGFSTGCHLLSTPVNRARKLGLGHQAWATRGSAGAAMPSLLRTSSRSARSRAKSTCSILTSSTLSE